MNADQLTRWATTEPRLAALATGLLLLSLAATGYLIVRRAGGNVLVAGIGAMVCTGYSGDTSWRFARDHLGMTSPNERLFMFAAGEIALLSCAVMARANKKATATDDSAGTPGVPGVLVWCITSIQLVPAFTESGFWAGLVRGAIGPAMAALLWHLAMGLEIRVTRPEALSSGLPAQIGHELRERLLSYLGLATRDRTAEEITRDRAHSRAVRLGARRHLGPWGRARLAAAVTRSRATVDGNRRHRLLQDLAGRRTAEQLRTMEVPSPWVADPAAQPHPATPLGVTGAELRRMHPMDAIQTVRDAHPDATAPELAPAPQPEPDDFDSAAASALAVAQPHTVIRIGTDASASVIEHVARDEALILDLAPAQPLHPDVQHRPPADPEAAQPKPPQVTPDSDAPRPRAATPVGKKQPVSPLRAPDADAQLLERAKSLNNAALVEDGKKVSLRVLQRTLGIGQRRAQRIQAQLPDALDNPADADAQPPAKEA
ncbi:hypothetical protein [Streptomyces sp. NPDC020298]|uniref:hypothetical protein n=1 Tax=unclassified Streptomyces TaxID=2593676 RepID=UPI0033D5C2F8